MRHARGLAAPGISMRGKYGRQRSSRHASERARGTACQGGFREGSLKGVHHVGILTEDLPQCLHFYKGILGLKERDDRPDDKLPYKGAWLDLGTEMLHIMDVNNPDAGIERPEHGGRDRHFCVGVAQGSVDHLISTLDSEGIPYTKSKSGRPAIFFRDPDRNTIEVVEMADWR